MVGGYTAGVDEAGRGAIAGPVVAAAVILPHTHNIEGLADSKKLSPAARFRLADDIVSQCVCWAYSCGEVEEIDQINILRSTLASMKRAIEALSVQPERVVVDGNQVPQVSIEARAIIKGDESVPVISAASILAKTTRDRIMFEWANTYPDYGFQSHVGYGTRQHIAALHRFGVLPIHRRTFAPVKRVLEEIHRLI